MVLNRTLSYQVIVWRASSIPTGKCRWREQAKVRVCVLKSIKQCKHKAIYEVENRQEDRQRGEELPEHAVSYNNSRHAGFWTYSLKTNNEKSSWILWGHKSTALGSLQRIAHVTKRNCLFTCNKASDSFNITSGPKAMDIVLISPLIWWEMNVKLNCNFAQTYSEWNQLIIS